MRQSIITAMAALALGAASLAHAGDLNIRLLLSGEVAPGVYGQVQIGNDAPPPPLVYSQPVYVAPAPDYDRLPPVYLHVPPGHAKNWRKHCREYNACNRRVYFIRSREYEPNFDRREYDRDRGRDRDRGDDHDHGRGHDRGDDHDHGRGHDRGDD